VRYEIEVNGRVKQLNVHRRGERFAVSLDEHEWMVDAAAVGSHTLSLLIERSARGIDGAAPRESREISVATDAASGHLVFGIGTVPFSVNLNTRRRWGRKDEGRQHGGPQRLVAPMPGKVVRVLAAPGDRVVTRQPIVVIEAMKMENELRAAREGSVKEVLVTEGQSVEAGTLLALIAPV
jgi:biotin carboxyl carrier protein